MRYIDIFNGDADGIISLIQLRLAEPRKSTLVTGVKRDNQLMNSVSFQAGDQVTVLDISMQKNLVGLNSALEAGAQVNYVDHHQAGDIPLHHHLAATVDTSPDVCTALLIDKRLNGQYHHWAIAAAYGDNLVAKADQLAEQAGLNNSQQEQLRELGVLINYNGYGTHLADLHFEPAALYHLLVKYNSPFDVINDPSSPYYLLKSAYAEDMVSANSAGAYYQTDTVKVTILPNTAWSRRVSGVFGNELANQSPAQAQIVVTEGAAGDYVVSLRAPLSNKQGAGLLCSKFASGGGREAAAGINSLAKTELSHLIATVEAYYK